VADEPKFGGSSASDHGGLSGLADDDHTQYVLADGTRAMTSLTIPTDAVDGYVLTCDEDGVAAWSATSATVAGSDKQVQFNDGGVLAGSAYLTFNKGGKELKCESFMGYGSTGVRLREGTNGLGIRISDTYGNLGVKCEPGATSDVDINGSTIRIRTLTTPATSTATGIQGQIMIDGSYIYVCTTTNNWKRATLNSF